MEFAHVTSIKPSDHPLANRHYARLYPKAARKMASSSSSKRHVHSTAPGGRGSSTGELAELSDVPCYTCRRRHVKCDRILPTCAKCAKKGVPCLGYQKPLRWADGVAVRGKLKGKSEPVVDSNVVNIIRNTIQIPSNSVMKEAAHFGLHATKSAFTDVGSNDATVMELMKYHNTCMRAERVTLEETHFIEREIAPLSFEIMHKLPRDVVNCVLGIAAVHKASRSPSNRSLERLALESKVNVFQSFNRLLQSANNSQADLIVVGGLLIFAMDLFEYGLNRWMLHFLGSLHVMSSFGGIENLLIYYPHLELPMTHAAHFETFWPVLSHIAITKPKQASRKAVEMLCRGSLAKRKFFTPSPPPLRVLVWDIGSCASRMLLNREQASQSDVHKREQILHAILAFQPRDSSLNLMDHFVPDNKDG
ncbi:hypothetical protein B0J11DRAFT_308980 [Dendryphion nanum]|uniref:Zn(2)-C6 fungal-type domain-containing protein n=1 Tax=Dendryphion nanum TaxID=256645 RepID=A0A9P9IM92_9PLEO|nr:hypothetical protein B0J11DRAFT_308980 [Dendryphion nanum]